MFLYLYAAVILLAPSIAIPPSCHSYRVTLCLPMHTMLYCVVYARQVTCTASVRNLLSEQYASGLTAA